MSDTTDSHPEPPPIVSAPASFARPQHEESVSSAADEPAWFARRFPVGHAHNAMGPVHWKGWAAMALYVAATLFGAAAFLVMAIAGMFVTGVILFAVIAFGALLALLIVATLKGDETKTIEDYAKDKRSVRN